MSISLAAYIKGFMEYKEKSHIKGVIFNQMSPMLYPRMKKLVEEQLEVEVLGYVPKVEDCVIESRHLGLVLPEEISDLRERLQKLAGILEDTLKSTGSLACQKCRGAASAGISDTERQDIWILSATEAAYRSGKG